jgi:hypothetical protein
MTSDNNRQWDINPDSEDTTDTTQATAYNEVFSFEEEILSLVGKTSEKFVPAPSHDQVLVDAIEALRRFKEGVRWKSFFRNKKLEELQKQQLQQGILTIESLRSSDIDDDLSEDAQQEGLRTGLKVKTLSSIALKADDKVELFLKRVEEEVLNQAFSYSPLSVESDRSKQVRRLLYPSRQQIPSSSSHGQNQHLPTYATPQVCRPDEPTYCQQRH